MFDYTSYNPFICIGIVLVILLILWFFLADKPYEFVGLAPLAPDTCINYSGSPYTWSNLKNTNLKDNDPKNSDENKNIRITMPENSACTIENIGTTGCVPLSVDTTPAVPVEFMAEKNVCLGTAAKTELLAQMRKNIVKVPKVSASVNKSGKFVSRGEKICQKTIEQIYGVPFLSIRPQWLKNPETKCNLELDCYNDDLKLAVEYNGEQHYKWPNFTNQTYEQFINQIRRDQYKADVCEKMGVYLITVPYNISHDKISSFILSQLPETIKKRKENV
jgi:hypothetical protein